MKNQYHDEFKDELKRLPYFVEKDVLKIIKNFLSKRDKFVTENGKILNTQEKRFIWKLENKISRMNNTELNLFLNKIKTEDCEWGCNYLFSGKRMKEHLCTTESLEAADIRKDNFLTFNGVSIF